MCVCECVCECVCVCVSAIEVQTIGPISKKFGTVDDHDPEWFLCIFENKMSSGCPPLAGKHLLAKPCTLQKISQNKSCRTYPTMGCMLTIFFLLFLVLTSILPKANVIKLFTPAIYCQSMVIPSFCVKSYIDLVITLEWQ